MTPLQQPNGAVIAVAVSVPLWMSVRDVRALVVEPLGAQRSVLRYYTLTVSANTDRLSLFWQSLISVVLVSASH